jgi:hypothetical protein
LSGLSAAEPAAALPPLVPGSGQKAVQVGDDFEDPQWEFYTNLPKSAENINEEQYLPGGYAKNGRWYEGIKRGTPDLVKRVPTPEGGLPDSKGALLLRSLFTGISGRPSYNMQQDDFICDISERLGGAIPVSQQPNFVVRVFLPPVSKWERRSGPHFAIRAAVDTHTWEHEKGGRYWGRELYYPGFFLEFDTKENNGLGYDTAYIRIRANESGHDYRGPQITNTGWWTFGMSFTADGKVHYYAHEGLDDLTAADKIATHNPYGFRCERFKTFFFNVCSADDGRTWSTPVIIDDPTLYFSPLELARAPRSGVPAPTTTRLR